MSWSFVVPSLCSFVVGRTRPAGEFLRLNLLDIELRYALAHCFQNIFERWRFVLNPSQRADARYNNDRKYGLTDSRSFNFLTIAATLSSISSTIVALLVLLKRRSSVSFAL